MRSDAWRHGRNPKSTGAGRASLRRTVRRDQLEVARRVDVACAGTRLPAKRLTPDRLRRKVLEAVSKADGAKRVADGFAAAGGPRAAADAFEQQLIASKTTSGR